MSNLTRTTAVNQAIRINVLRLAFIACLPLILFSRSAWSEPVFGAMEIMGLACIVAAVLGRFWAILYIGGHKNQGVMQDGPYSVCRHPLYFFSTVGVVGFGLLLGSLALTLLLGALTFTILAITARKEEAFLRGTFGAAHDAYAARVPMILPQPALFRTPDRITVSVGHLRGNLMDALVFLLFVPFAELAEYAKDHRLIRTFPLF